MSRMKKKMLMLLLAALAAEAVHIAATFFTGKLSSRISSKHIIYNEHKLLA